MARKPASERRAQLVEAGLRVIAREGMHGATVRAIVAEAGLPLATFHYVFASRDEMIGEAYAFTTETPSAELAELPPGATFEDAMGALLQRWFEDTIAHEEHELAVMEIMTYCRRTPSLSHLPAAVQQRYVEAVADLIDILRARFGITGAAPVSEVAPLVLHVTDGLTYHWMRTHDRDAAMRTIAAATPVLAAAIAGTEELTGAQRSER